MKKIMILVAVLASVVSAVGAVGLAYAQTASPPAAKTGTAAAATPAAGRQGTQSDDSSEMIVRSYMDAAQARLLGMTTADYQAQEDAGKTWLEIATAQGKTAAETQALLETAYSNAIAQALADDKITQSQADALKAAAAPTLANVGVPGHGQPGGIDNGHPGGPGGRGPGSIGGPGGNGIDTAPTGTTTTPMTNG